MVLTIILMIALIKGILPMSVLFMLAFCIAMLINYPDVDMQKKRIAMHADSILAVVGLIFAAGILQVFYLAQAWLKRCQRICRNDSCKHGTLSGSNYSVGKHAFDVLYVK